MVEYDRHSQRAEAAPSALRTCIVGIGGAGSNVLDRITLDRTAEVEARLVCLHTDVRVLSHAMAPVKIQLGAELVRGVGAGGDPELGREAALASRDEIRQALEGHDIVFICTGLGGGTGSGAAPVVAEIAKSTKALVFVTATMPFGFEGRRRLAQAEEALQQLQKRADALILFENNRMGELILPKDGIQKAFLEADKLIAQSLRAVSTIVTLPGLVKLGLDDLTAALSTSNGRCLFGFGEARGSNRGAEALKRALKSPLIDQGRLLHQTKTLLVHVAGGESLTLLEVDGIMKQLGRHVPDHTHILFGVAVDARLGDAVAVTLISSLGLAQLNTLAAAAPPADMLPLTNRTMPSVVEAVAAAPVPEPPAPLAEAPAPTAQAEAVAEPEPAAPQAPAVPEAPETGTKSASDLFAPREEAAAVPPPAESPAPEASDLLADHPAVAEVIAQIAGEARAEPPAVPAAESPAAAEPASPPAPRERLRIEDFIPVVPRTSLATIVARATPPAPEPAPAYAPPATIPVTRPVAAELPLSPPPAAKTPANEQQIDFRFHEEDRGRFKDTEPAMASGGENLDVPTWMRLKRKLKR